MTAIRSAPIMRPDWRISRMRRSTSRADSSRPSCSWGSAGDAVLLIQNAYRDRDLVLASQVVLHGFEAGDHGLDLAAGEFRLLDKLGAIIREGRLPGAQPGIFLTQAIADLDEFIHLLFKGLEYRIGSRYQLPTLG
jgi:hypothetical protein